MLKANAQLSRILPVTTAVLPPKDRHPDFAGLNTADRDSVARLGAILRLADGLDRSHESRVRELECVVEGDVVKITVHSDVDCEKEMVEAERRRPLFEQAFDYNLSINVKSAKSRG